jgi:hypothetical protein
LYQKSSGIIEGDSDNSIIRIDNLAELNASKFNSKTSDLTIEGKASCSLLVENNFTLDANDNTEINVYGNPKIEIRKFSGEAKLLKRLPIKK